MPVFISLLRGINVSGQKKIKMDELRKLYESLDYVNVKTYIQSGNVIFNGPEEDILKIQVSIKDKIRQELGYDVSIIMRTPEEIKSIIDSNPFSDKDLSKVLVTFLSVSGYDSSIEEIVKSKAEQEEFQIKDREIYLYLPYGSGKTKLTNNLFERILGMKTTTRNWRTVNKILEISRLL